MKKNKNILILTVLIIGIIFVSCFSTALNFFVDYEWFKEVGYTSTYLRQIFSKIYVGIPIFVFVFMFIYFYFLGMKKNYYKHMNIIVNKAEEKNINMITFLSSFLISVFYSTGVASNFWMQILKFNNPTSFNVKDPIFSKDISFYVFKLPLINEILNSLSTLLIFLFVVTMLYYVVLGYMTKSFNYGVFGNDINELKGDVKFLLNNIFSLAIKQITIMGVILFAIMAMRNYLEAFELVYSPRGVAYGASYTDTHVNLVKYRIDMIISIFGCFLCIIAYRKRKLNIALIAPTLLIGVTVISLIAEMGVQNIIVSPNELAKERPYLKYNIELTKKAYNLDNIQEKDFVADRDLTAQDILNNEETIRNISVNDYRPTKEAFNQLQRKRSYYKFNNIDIDRYDIDGKITQVYLSARELDKNSLDSKAKTWMNTYIKYTHGYGLALSAVNEITSSGEPKLLVSDIPPKSNLKKFQIKRPEIYFGEITNDYILTNTLEKEFDYPKGDTNAFTEYKGSAGIKLDTINKLLFAIKQNNYKLLVSSNVNKDSKILLNRNILDRVEKIAPFLSFEDDPYLVVNEGKLFWIIDGYTHTSRYPYSQPYSENGINYIRNSFKVVVDAYNGTVDFYLSDKNDPIINTYSKIFPQLFKPLEKMPKGLKSHIRYPQNLFEIQAKAYETYHMKDTDVFYNKEDMWRISGDLKVEGEDSEEVNSNYVTFKLPDEQKAEFLLSLSYTPSKAPNMAAILVARNDKDNYGQLINYRFPKDTDVLGPDQVEAIINGDTEISKNLTLWGSGGSRVIKGHLMTIPIEKSILYVKPLYIKSDSAQSIPQVKKIIAVYKDRVVMEDSLDKALNKLFDSNKIDTNQYNNEESDNQQLGKDKTTKEYIQEANDLYNKADEAIRNKDFAKYGQYIDELGKVLNELNM